MASQDSSQALNGVIIVVASIAAVCGILFGFDTGVISGAILFLDHQWNFSALMNGLLVSSVLFGAFVGALAGGVVADRFGRRNVLLATSLIFLFATGLSALAANYLTLLIARLFVGFAIGIAAFVAPVYISEIAPASHRGKLVSLNQLAVTIGILLAFLVDVLCSKWFSDATAWRWMFAAGIVPAVVLFIGLLFLPQSPRWLLLKGYESEALEKLRWLRRQQNVEKELDVMRVNLVDGGSWRDMWQSWLRPAFIIGFGLGFFQQFTGINTIIYYAPTIFQMAGQHSNTAALLSTVGVGVVNVLFTIIALPLIDRLGRRPLLFIGLALMVMSLLALAVAFHLGQGVTWLPSIALLGMLFFIVGFAISLGPIMWLMFAEIFPLSIRARAASLAAAVSWLFNGIVSGSFKALVAYLGVSNTFVLYGFIGLLGLVFVFYCVPETKGVDLELIESNLRKGLSGRNLVRPS